MEVPVGQVNFRGSLPCLASIVLEPMLHTGVSRVSDLSCSSSWDNVAWPIWAKNTHKYWLNSKFQCVEFFYSSYTYIGIPLKFLPEKKYRWLGMSSRFDLDLQPLKHKAGNGQL